MPVSIEELDATVRAFYEGRGEQVFSPSRSGSRAVAVKVVLTNNLSKQQKAAQAALNQARPATHPSCRIARALD